MHVIHSDVIKGVGLFCGGPFHTAFTNNGDSYEQMMALEFARQYEDEGSIDSLENLRDSKVYIFGGMLD